MAARNHYLAMPRVDHRLLSLDARSVVDICGANNVVFTEVRADLHLDQLKWDLAWSLKLMPGRSKDKGAFAFAQLTH